MVMTEERLSRLEGAYEQVDQRLGDLTLAIADLRSEMAEQNSALRAEMARENGALRSELVSQVSDLRAEMNTRFNNLYLLAGGAWVSTVGIMVGLFLGT